MRASSLSALLGVALAAGLWTASPAAAAPAAGSVLIEKVTVVSPERGTPLTDAFVLIEGGKIRSVATVRPAAAKGVRVVDGRGRFLVPGLIDSHTHVGVPPGVSLASPDFERRHADMLAAYWRQAPRSYLYHGVTAVVDLASPAGAVERFRAEPLAPDVVSCAPLTLERGYPVSSLPPEVRSRFIAYPLPEDPAAAAGLVQRARQDGHRCIKLFFEDGFGEATNLPLPSASVAAAVRAEARRLGMPLVIHANALDMQTAALRHQPDVLAHGLWHWGAAGDAPGLPEPIRRHLDAVRASGVALQPTFGALDGLANLFEPGFLDDPALQKVVPPQLLAWYRTEEAQFFKQEFLAEEPGFANPAVARRVFRPVVTRNERAVAYLAKHGGKILLGSDTPSAPTWADQPGLNTWRELQHMARAGLSPRDLLLAATLRNAETFGLADLGTIAPGKAANLLLLRADPLASVEAWNAIEMVILHGQVIPRESLAVAAPAQPSGR
jgi:Amidohydrolase family